MRKPCCRILSIYRVMNTHRETQTHHPMPIHIMPPFPFLYKHNHTNTLPTNPPRSAHHPHLPTTSNILIIHIWITHTDQQDEECFLLLVPRPLPRLLLRSADQCCNSMRHRRHEGRLVRLIRHRQGRQAVGSVLHGPATACSDREVGWWQEGNMPLPQDRRQELFRRPGQVLEPDPYCLQH